MESTRQKFSGTFFISGMILTKERIQRILEQFDLVFLAFSISNEYKPGKMLKMPKDKKRNPEKPYQ